MLLLLLSSCQFFRKPIDFPAYNFTVDTLYFATPVKHQGKSSNCWAYAAASLLETEYWTANDGTDTLNLSPEYIVRSSYQAKFDHYCHAGGKEEICTGGLGHTFIQTFRKAGIVPWQAYDSCYRHRPAYSKLLKNIRHLAREAVSQPEQEASCKLDLSALLDQQMGSLPDSFLYDGKRFTPQTFAQLLPAVRREYIELTSFANQPYHAYCSLDLRDNWEHAAFYNLPLNQLMNVMTSALQHGTTFVWDGDVSERSFSINKGFAFCPSEMRVSEQTRLFAFLSGETRDDHMMHIIGLAHNQFGERFFIAKNSVGNAGPYHGYLYLSEEYVRLKTISILIDKHAITKLLKQN